MGQNLLIRLALSIRMTLYFYVSYAKNAYNNTYETFSFKWESDSLSVLDHNNFQVPTNKFSLKDSLALLAL